MQVTTRSAFTVPVDSSISPGRIATGTAPKRKCTASGLSPGPCPANPLKISRFLVLRNRSGVGSPAGGATSSPSACARATARPRRPISASSLLVKEACSGPRRPITWMSVSGAAAMAAPASGTMSLLIISSALLARRRAASSATLPLPITATDWTAERSGPERQSGWPFSQPMKRHEPQTWERSSPGTPSLRSTTMPVATITAS